MNNSQNILKSNNKRSFYITIVILFLLFFCFMLYATYVYLQYKYKNNIQSDSIEVIVSALNEMFTSQANGLPLNFNVFCTLLVFQVKNLWFVYVALVLIVFLSVTSRSTNDFKRIEQGSARWSNKDEKKDFMKDNTGIPVAKDFYVPIKDSVTANLNEIVIGGSGAGKSFRKIKPDLMQMFGSYVVTDPKGELYRDTAKLLSDNGYKVRVLNLVNITLSNSYNPFAYMTNEQDVVSICSLFMKNTAGDGEKEDFWTGAALKLLTAVSIYLFKDTNEVKSFGRVIRLVNSIRYTRGQIDMSCEFARCMNKHVTINPFDAAAVNWAGIQGTPQETLASITETLSTRLRLWSVSELDALTANDEMDFDSIGAEKTAIFLIIPAARQTYKAVANIFYSQLFERLQRIAEEKYNGRLPLLVSCELDEFANIGEIPCFNETLSIVRSYNIRICIVLQGLSQLKAIYEKTWESIIGNCDIFTFLGSKDNDTLEYVSKKLGNITARNDSKSYNRGSQGGGSDTEAHTGRALLMPDEIKQAVRPKGKNKKYGGGCIIFIGYFYPFYLFKFDTLSHPNIKYCGSSFEKDFHNNTNIRDVYESIWEERLIKYNNNQNEQRKRLIIEEEKFKKEQLQNELKQQQAYEAEWNNNIEHDDFNVDMPDIEMIGDEK